MRNLNGTNLNGERSHISHV